MCKGVLKVVANEAIAKMMAIISFLSERFSSVHAKAALAYSRNE